jgi:CRP-like cAMP-binding protein
MPATLPVFGALRTRDVRSLAGPVIEAIVPQGTELVREGTTIGVFSVIRTGSVAACRGEDTVALLGAGDCFGESDPREPTAQPFTLVARTTVRLTTFSAFGIDRLCAAIPGARERLSRARAAALAQGVGIEHRDRAVVGGHPSQLAHQPKRPRHGLPRRPGPARELVLRKR